MTKTEQWELVKEILTNGKVSKKVQSELEVILAPKTSGGSIYPPKVDKDNNIIELYCNWHKEYEPAENFKKSPKAKSGYHYECKDAETEWKKYASKINEIKAEISTIVNSVLDETISVEEAKAQKSDKEKEIEKYIKGRRDKIDFADFKGL